MARALLAVLLTASACGFSFDPASQVKDLRVLAVSVDPPELSAMNARAPVSLRALVVDTDLSESVTWSLAFCVVAPTASGLASGARCPDGSTVVAQGNGPLGSIAGTLPLPAQVLGLLATPRAIVPQLQLELTVGEAPLYAEKVVTLTAQPVAGQALNLNPTLSGLTFDGQPWLAGTPLVVKAGTCAPDKLETVTNADRSKSTFCTHDLVPGFDEAQQQFFSARSAITGEVTVQQEKLRFAWFADQGVFHSDTTAQAGAGNTPRASGNVANVWREVAGLSGTVTFWVVVRDGRGGESWEVRTLQLE